MWPVFSYSNREDEMNPQQFPFIANIKEFDDFDASLVAQKVLSSNEFQNLLTAHKQLKSQQGKFEEKLQKSSHNQELYMKLEDQQNLQQQLLIDVEMIKLQIEKLNTQRQKYDSQQSSFQEPGFILWRQKVRDLNSRIRLLQNAQMHFSKRIEDCCNRPPAVEIEAHVIKFLSGLFNSEKEAERKAPHVHHWIHSLFVAKDELERKLSQINQRVSQEAREAANRTANIVMASVSERIKEEFLRHHQESMICADHCETASAELYGGTGGLSHKEVQKIVEGALAKYDADKTGMVDYALESSGGSIVSTRCTENYQARTAMLTVMGVFHWYPSSVSPRTVIQPGVHPGNCWAFAGSEGFLVIQLSAWVRITTFSIEHIPRSLSPSGKLDSAPKDFRVMGLQHEKDNSSMEIGRYQFKENGTSLQYFKVERSDLPPFQMVELQIESNHGNMEYTCLYRFRVHGDRVTNTDFQR